MNCSGKQAFRCLSKKSRRIKSLGDICLPWYWYSYARPPNTRTRTKLMQISLYSGHLFFLPTFAHRFFNHLFANSSNPSPSTLMPTHSSILFAPTLGP